MYGEGTGGVLVGSGVDPEAMKALPQNWQKTAPAGLLPPQWGQIWEAISRARETRPT